MLLVLVAYCPAAAQCLPAASCQPGSAPTNPLNLGFGIMRVRLANLDTITNGASDGYQDYSCRRPIYLTRGTTYTLQATTGPNTNEQVRAWADFNQDGKFDLVTEAILSSLDQPHIGSFTVPSSLPVGASLRLRIAADDINSPVPGPCTTPQYSQTEDYRIVITAAPLPPPQAAFGALDSVTCGAAVQLRDHSRNAPTSWRWELGDGTYSTQQHVTHRYVAAGTYTVRLRVCNASGCDSLAKPACIVVRTDGPKAASCQPATLAYCCQFGVDQVRLAGLNHRPGGGAASYQDASCIYRATLRADWPDTLHLTTGGQGAHDVRVYLDLNNDGQLDPIKELLYQGLAVKSPAIPLRINSTLAGLVYNTALRLRICADYAGSSAVGPCAAPQWGQVVDYSVSIIPNTLKPQAAFSLTYAEACEPVKISVVNTSIGSVSYQWDFGDGTTTSVANPSTHTYTKAGIYTIRLITAGPAGIDSTQQQTAVAACPTYCTTGGWGGNEDSPLYFTRVTVANIDNKEFRGPRVGYRDFTHYVATVHQGQVVAIHTESLPFTSGGSGPWVLSTAWIDYNQDGKFSASEQLKESSGLSPQIIYFQLSHTARLGATRLRLTMHLVVSNEVLYSNGCQPSSSLSTTEDYTLLILPEQASPRTGFTADLLSSCSGQVQFQDTTWSSPKAWNWNFGDGTSSTEANPLHTYAGPGLYSVSLETRNAYGTSMVQRIDYITVTASEQGPRPAKVTLSNRMPYGSYGIARAMLSTLTYVGGENLPGYRDESCQQPALHLVAGSTYPLLVTRTPHPCYYHVYLWLDANDNGVLEPQERIDSLYTTTIDETQRGFFTVPMGTIRNRPLRLRLYWHALRINDYPLGSPTPDPQTRDEDYDEVRDFTAWVGSTLLATYLPTAVQSWSYYPNPTTGLLTLTGVNASSSIQVINSLGQLIGCFTTVPEAGGQYQVDLHSLPKGLYVMRLNGVAGTRRVTLE